MAVKLDYDVVIIGAGISGINTAYYIKNQLPSLSFVVFERRDNLGGTWDFWKYPGIRSDSDLYTFGFSWNPWNDDHPIAEAKSIMAYLNSTVAKFGLDKYIQYHVQLQQSDWSSKEKTWKLSIKRNGELETVVCSFLILATGYYDYQTPLEATIPGIRNFKYDIIHPQFWNEKFDYTNKRIVVIGSGATAITLIPSLAKKAKHIVMLQRSPSYILSIPNISRTSFLKRYLPTALTSPLNRFYYILFPHIFYMFCQRFPRVAKAALQCITEKQLPSSVPINPHFNPSYFPWQQRLCVSPDGDFYRCIREKKASVATGIIKMVNESSITLESGDVIPADVIITATGLRLMLAGGSKVLLDGQQPKMEDKFVWNSMMIQDIPNLCIVLGYPNASWTLGADVIAHYLVRIMKVMKQRNARCVTPRLTPEEQVDMKPLPLFYLTSTYVKKASGKLPCAGNMGPWMPHESYPYDYFRSFFTSVTKNLEYTP